MRNKLKLGNALFIVVIVVYVAIVLGIIATVVLNSVSKGWYSGVFPKTFTTEWYKYASDDHDIPNLIGVTFITAIADVLIGLLIAFPAAYALARTEFKGKGLLLSLFLLPMIVPPMAYGIPLAMLCYKFRLAGRVIGTIIVNLVPIVPFMILVLMPFIEQVGMNLESAAKMLGAKRSTIFHKILIPLTLPGIFTAGILSLVKSISMFDLTYLIAGGKNQTIVVALFSDAYAAGARPPQSVDALAVIYFLIAMISLLISLRLREPHADGLQGKVRSGAPPWGEPLFSLPRPGGALTLTSFARLRSARPTVRTVMRAKREPRVDVLYSRGNSCHYLHYVEFSSKRKSRHSKRKVASP